MKAKIFLLFVLWVSFSLVVSAYASIEQYLGEWANEDADTQGMTKLNIERQGNQIFMQAWGKCTPQDCDWGRVPANVFAPDVRSNPLVKTSALSALFRTGNIHTTVIITILQSNQAKIITLTNFKGQDSRPNLQNEYVFRRTVIDGRRILVPIRPRLEVLKMPSPQPEPLSKAEPERTVLSDGSLQITYPDGYKKVTSKNFGTVHITTPDGMSQIYSKSQVPFHDLPALPEDNPLNQWLHQESESLLNTIERLLQSDQAAIDKYLTAYEGSDLSLYEKIHKRVQAINVFTEPQPE